MKKHVVKVCGMGCPDAISDISRLGVDYLGAVFYEKSPRFAPNFQGSARAFQSLDSAIGRVGVFVNASRETITHRAREYSLSVFQLHGNESPAFCRSLSSLGQVWKAFGVYDAFDFSCLNAYEDVVDGFVFDTKTRTHGGSGRKFDRECLYSYQGKTPFLIAGGIGVEDARSLRMYSHPSFAGADLNSRFEIDYGIKDRIQVELFIKEYKQL
ncbi:MAG: phosphoribosylanthranilate isomerase [Fibrobacterota bacterium]